MRYSYGYGFDFTYVLVLIGFVLCLGASALVKSTMKKYSKVRCSTGISGAEAAVRILRNEGIYDVQVECLSGDSGDHYDPRSKTVRLSRANFHSASVTAVGVAAHECGHAIQHEKGYAPLSFRTALLPAANIGSRWGVPMIMLGMLFSWNQWLITIGIWAFALGVLFQIVTLPVEFNASHRAVIKVEEYGLMTHEENVGCKKVLTAAALTYVAAAASAILQLLRLFLLNNRRRR
ncbi:MAG: zinc metallopeptidase [Lachnospiraceae bacterium]|nr:zinc metallopeptidase [Lachnospiraceae bacterium]